MTARWLLFAHADKPNPTHVAHLVTEEEARLQARANDWRPACGATAKCVGVPQRHGYALACAGCMEMAVTS